MVANIMRKSKAGLINSSALVVMHNATKTMGSDGPSFHSWSKSSKEVLVALRRLEANIETVPAQLHTAQRLAYHAVRKSYITIQPLFVQAQIVRHGAKGSQGDNEHLANAKVGSYSDITA